MDHRPSASSCYNSIWRQIFIGPEKRRFWAIKMLLLLKVGYLIFIWGQVSVVNHFIHHPFRRSRHQLSRGIVLWRWGRCYMCRLLVLFPSASISCCPWSKYSIEWAWFVRGSSGNHSSFRGLASVVSKVGLGSCFRFVFFRQKNVESRERGWFLIRKESLFTSSLQCRDFFVWWTVVRKRSIILFTLSLSSWISMCYCRLLPSQNRWGFPLPLD